MVNYLTVTTTPPPVAVLKYLNMPKGSSDHAGAPASTPVHYDWLLVPPRGPRFAYSLGRIATFKPIDLRMNELPNVLRTGYKVTLNGEPKGTLLPPTLCYGYPIPYAEDPYTFLKQIEGKIGKGVDYLDYESAHGCGDMWIMAFGSNNEDPYAKCSLELINDVRHILISLFGSDPGEPMWYLAATRDRWVGSW